MQAMQALIASDNDLYECEILNLERQDESILTLTLRRENITRLFPAGRTGDSTLRLLVQPKTAAQRPLPQPSARLRSELQRALDYIHDNLETGMSLQEVADAAGLSVHHFAHLFKESIGETPHRYVIRQRVERARRLLEQGDLSLAEVALAVGFYDQAHFTNNFKRLTGTTPRAARDGRERLRRAS
jgi:AraC family transcriptional regulator